MAAFRILSARVVGRPVVSECPPEIAAELSTLPAGTGFETRRSASDVSSGADISPLASLRGWKTWTWGLVLGGVLLSQSGCGLMTMGKETFHALARQFTPKGRDYIDTANDEGALIDDWSQVGTEARGDKSRDKESDWFTQFETPKARAINRNLGIE